MHMLLAGSMLSSKAFVAQRPVAFTSPTIAAPRISARQMVVAEAEKESEPSEAKKMKAAELRTQFTSAEALMEEVERLRRELFTMRIKFAKREEYKPAQKAALRQRVAQLLTIKREREIEAGIDRREALATEKRRLVEAGLGKF